MEYRRSVPGAVFVAAALALAFPASAQHPLDGTWVLSEKASKNVPDSLKGVDVKIHVQAERITTVRLVDTRQIGQALIVIVDGSAHQTDIGNNQTASIEARWANDLRGWEQTVKLKSSTPGLPAVQKTVSTLSPDGNTLTRVQTTYQFGKSEERILVYRRKPTA